MRRRRLLAGLAAFAALAGGMPARARATPRSREEGLLLALAWGSGELHACLAGGRAYRVVDDIDARVPPGRADDGTLAFVRADGRVAIGWLEGGEPWRPRHLLDPGDACHALALSADGTWLLAAHGEALTLLEARSGTVARRYRGEDRLGRRTGRAAALFALPHRRSLLAAWPGLGEWWEISLDPKAPPVFDGLVHDYRMGEAIARPGYLGVRRVPFDGPAPMPGFVDPRVAWVGAHDGDRVTIVHLDVRRTIAGWRLPAARPGAALLRGSTGAWRWWLPAGDAVQVVDASRWPVALPATDHVALPAIVRAVVEWPSGPGALVERRLDGRQVLQPMRWSKATAASAGSQDDWQPTGQLLEAGSEPAAIAADAAAGRMLVGASGALTLLGAQGAVLDAWRFPATFAFAGVALGQSG